MTEKNFWELIDYPVTTEKAVKMIEEETKTIPKNNLFII